MTPLPNTLIDGWTPDEKVAKWAEKNGFGRPRAMTDANLRALAKTRGGKPSGLYLWESADHKVYIGISTDSVVKRLRAHLKAYPEAKIQSFRYQHGSKDSAALRSIERDLIHEAQWAGFDCFNSEHSSSIYGDSTFDEKISVARQTAWFDDPAGKNANVRGARRDVSSSEQTRASTKFTRFVERCDADEVIGAISLYLRCCVPYPTETEVEYWGITCLPALRLDDGYQRVCTLSMGMIEMLWFNQSPTGQVFVNVGTDYRFLPDRGTKLKLRRLGATASGGVVHPSGGANEEVLTFKDVASFIAALKKSQPIRVAAARFALDRMRKGRLSGRYRDAHNALLAQEAIDRIKRWQVKSRPLGDLFDKTLLS